MVFVGSGLYSFDERSLCGVEDIRLVPLEENGVHGHTLASDAPFICLEPWTSLPATDGKRYDLEKKEDAILLPAGETYETAWSIELHE